VNDNVAPTRGRAKALAAMQAVIRRVERDDDLSILLDPDVVTAAQELVDVHLYPDGVATPDDPIRSGIYHTLGWFRWFRAMVVPDEPEAEVAMAIRFFSSCFLDMNEAHRFPPELLPQIAHRAGTELAEMQNLIGHESVRIRDRVVDMWRHVIRTVEETGGPPERFLLNLCHALYWSFLNTGVIAHLDEAILLSRRLLADQQLPEADTGVVAVNLGSYLLQRYEVTASLDDLQEAITVQCSAAAAAAEHRDLELHLSSLSGLLLRRFERRHDTRDLDAASHAARIAVALASDRTDRARSLSTLKWVLLARFDLTRSRNDLDEAIDVARQATSLWAPSLDADADRHTGLAEALHSRYVLTGELTDLDESIDALRTAVELAGRGQQWNRVVDHPHLTPTLGRLGDLLFERHRRTGSDADWDAAVAAFAQAADSSTANPAQRISAARRLAGLLADTDPTRAASALESAIELLPLATSRRIRRRDQQHVLGAHAGLAGDAAALALSTPDGTPAERAARALRLLEAGRAVLFNQALDIRDDVSRLHEQHPELAERFVVLRDGVQRQDPGQDQHSLAVALDQVLAEIRALQGYADFGRPPAAGELIADAHAGAVVSFNISRMRSDALLVTDAGLTTVALPRLAYSDTVAAVNNFHQALHTSSAGATIADRRAGQAAIVKILEWLWDAAMAPVLAALGFQEPVTDEEWPRVWWITGGLLGYLPVHAAGHHDDPADDPGRRTVLDRVVSSYAPSMRALRHARQSAARRAGSSRALLVTSAGGQQPLPHAGAEIDAVIGHLDDHIVLADDGLVPTRDAVLSRLVDHAVVHFACHGVSDPTDPSTSRLLLAGGGLTVADLNTADLRTAELAYLSACETSAIRHPGLIDEAIHLASACQLAGFPHVIGTLWDVDDQVAAEIASAFYTGLRSGRTIETGRAARSLHDAVRAVRDRFPHTPSLWAAYLHTGV
jgi:tetratricopeptide (TPR) repeat protein